MTDRALDIMQYWWLIVQLLSYSCNDWSCGEATYHHNTCHHTRTITARVITHVPSQHVSLHTYHHNMCCLRRRHPHSPRYFQIHTSSGSKHKVNLSTVLMHAISCFSLVTSQSNSYWPADQSDIRSHLRGYPFARCMQPQLKCELADIDFFWQIGKYLQYILQIALFWTLSFVSVAS